jgi:plastocyanin
MKFVIFALFTLGPLAHGGLVPDSRAMDPGPSPQDSVVVVEITLEDDSVFVDQEVVTVRPGDRVEWVSEDGDWRVIFTSPDPFGPEAAQAGIAGSRGQRQGQAVRPDAPRGRYKYLIQLRDGNRMRILDPEVVVDPGPGR